MSFCTLSQIFTYPVKSLSAVEQSSLQLDEMGPCNDRRYMLINKRGEFVSQRHLPNMALISAELCGEDLLLSVESEMGSEGNDTLRVTKSDRGGFQKEVLVWSDYVQARDCGEQAAQWLSKYLKQQVRLVYMPDSTRRVVDPEFAQGGDIVSFADGFPLLLVSQSSLEKLNNRLDNAITINHFRPNLVISGCKPHEEDQWKKIRIGSEEFDIVKPCSRCIIPSINPLTAKKDPQIIKALSQYRRAGDKKIYFGQNLIHRSQGRLSLGDKVEILG